MLYNDKKKLFINQKKNKEFQNSLYFRDLFEEFRNIDCLQESINKSIKIHKSGLLIPFSKIYKKSYQKNYPRFYKDMKSKISSKRQSEFRFFISDNKGKLFGYIDLYYNSDCNTLSIKEIVYAIKSKSISFLKNSIISLLNYFNKTYFISEIYIYLEKYQENAINFFKSLSFLINNKALNKKFCKFIWVGHKKKIGKELILTAGPSVSTKEVSFTNDATTRGWNNNFNYYIEKLEKNFSKYVGTKYAIATSSCTGAMHIALKSLDIGPGDEVIVPDITWVATARVVEYIGATPIFCDVKIDNWNIDPDCVEKLINKKTKAIMVVHMYGNPADLAKLKTIAKKYNLYLIEDAAPAIGSLYRKKKCGSFGDFSAFSFQGAKLIVSGEGGILCTNNYKLYKIAKKISNQGRNPHKTFWIDSHGLKYKMSNLQAAFAFAQLNRIDDLVLMKRRIFFWYKEFLKKNNHIILLEENQHNYSNYWMSSIRIVNNKSNKRDKLINFLKKNNIDSRPVFSPISEYPIWNRSSRKNKTAKLVGYSSLNLPSGTSLTKNEVKYISKKINSFFDI